MKVKLLQILKIRERETIIVEVIDENFIIDKLNYIFNSKYELIGVIISDLSILFAGKNKNKNIKTLIIDIKKPFFKLKEGDILFLKDMV